MDTLLAGIAEKVAEDSGIDPPQWAGRVASLEEEYSGSTGTSRMLSVAMKKYPVLAN
jgi:hypothetical protein